MSRVRSEEVSPDPRDSFSIVDSIRTLGRFSLEQDTRTVTATYSMDLEDDLVLADATGGAFTVTLPFVADAQRKVYWVKRLNGGGNAVTVSGRTGENIDGALTVVLGAQYDRLAVLHNGTQWWRVD